MALSIYSLLLADSHGVSLGTGRLFFERRGFQVLTAIDGTSALELATSELPACVVLARSLSGLSGWAVCQRLKKERRTRALPVVVLGADPEDREKANAAGADALVSRKDGWEQLLETIGKILDVPIRRSSRIAVVFSVAEEGGSEGKETWGQAVDLSAGGMRLLANRPAEVASMVGLRFVLPGEKKQRRARARVRWAKRRSEHLFLLGLEFVSLSEADRKKLMAVVEHHATQDETGAGQAGTS
jgi:CheY-like chemotaxis protein